MSKNSSKSTAQVNKYQICCALIHTSFAGIYGHYACICIQQKQTLIVVNELQYIFNGHFVVYLFQLVLFLGVTILLASTYTTLYAQNQRIPDADAVVKIAPQPLQPVPKEPNEDSMGAGNDPNQQSNENSKKDGRELVSFVQSNNQISFLVPTGDSRFSEQITEN